MNKLLCAAAILACQAAFAAPLTVLCSVDQPVVEPRQTAVASVLTDSPAGTPLRYAWKATGGSFTPDNQSTANWSPGAAAPGPYTLSVSVASPDGSAGDCSLVVFAGRETRGGSQEPARQIRSAMLLPGKKEAPNFGLYSYMLLGSKPNAANRDRYVAFLQAFTDTVVAYDKLTEQLAPPQLNIAYLPVDREPPPNFKVEDWLLDHYDYDAARKLLESIPGTHTGDGPYIVSADHPLAGAGHPPAKYLFEDLTTVPVPIVKFWVNQFRIQTAQQRWDRATLSGVAVRIRTGLEIASIAYPEIRGSIATLLKGN